MSRSIVTSFIGEEGVVPQLYRMTTTDTYGRITEPGYLTNNSGMQFQPGAFLFAIYSDGAGGTKSGEFTLNISNGVITLTQSQSGGDVIGPGSSFDNAIALFSGTTGNQLKVIDFTPSPDTLFGFNDTATPADITVGAGLSLSGGVLSAAGAGSGDVVGPSFASISGALAVFSGTTGKAIAEPGFTPSANSLLGYGASHAVTNITAGANISISGGIISAAGAGTGNVSGSGTSVAGTFPVYADTTGLVIEPSAIALTNNTLLGVNAGAISNITAGSNITISGGVISATGSGTGNVTGPISSTNGDIAYWNNATGTLLGNNPLNPANNSLVGYLEPGKIVNVVAGTGITISGGVISAAGLGSGDVIGPNSSTDGSLALYSGTSGKVIQNTSYTPANSSLVGYNTIGKVANIITNATGSGLQNNGSNLKYQLGAVTSSGDFTATSSQQNTMIEFTNTTAVTLTLPVSNTMQNNAQIYAKVTGTSSVTVAVQGSDTLYNATGNNVLSIYDTATFINTDSNGWLMVTEGAGGDNLIPVQSITTDTYTIGLSNLKNVLWVNNDLSPVTITIPAPSSVDFPVGFNFRIFNQNSPYVLVSVTSPFTLLSMNVGYLGEINTYATLTYLGSNTWTMEIEIGYGQNNVQFYTNTNTLQLTAANGNGMFIINNFSLSSSTVFLPAASTVPFGWYCDVVRYGDSNSAHAVNVSVFTGSGDTIASLTSGGPFTSTVPLFPQAAYLRIRRGTNQGTAWYASGYLTS